MKKKADSLMPRVSQPCPALEKAAPCWEQGLFRALEVIVRQSMNGHPLGHDAMVAAERLLKQCAVDVMGRPAHLQCRCTPCSQARKAIKPPQQQPRTITDTERLDYWINHSQDWSGLSQVGPDDESDGIPPPCGKWFLNDDIDNSYYDTARDAIDALILQDEEDSRLAGGADATPAAANNNPSEDAHE